MLRVIVGSVSLLCLLGSVPAAAYEVVQQSPLTLHVSMERSEFFPGEPVLLGLTVQNSSSEPFADFAPMDADQGFVGFQLQRDRGVPLQSHGWITVAGRHEAPPLQTGERACHVVNLGSYFRDGPRALLPGSYVVRTRFNARSGARRDLSPLIIEGNEVKFTVQDTAAVPKEEEAAMELMDLAQRGPRLTPEGRNEARARYAESRYFPWVLGVFGRALDSTEVVEIARAVLARGRPLTAAMVLYTHQSRYSDAPDRGEAWLEVLERTREFRDVGCYLRTWRGYATQRRAYDRGSISPPRSPTVPTR